MKNATYLFLLLAACVTPSRPAPHGTRIIGHGGMGPEGDLPMNSEAAAVECLARDNDGVEVDVQMTADGILVAFHDERLNDLTDGKGLVHGLRAAEVDLLRYAEPYDDYGVARLSSIARAADSSHTLVLDCKLFAASDWNIYLDHYADALTQFVRDPAHGAMVNVECQVTEFLDRMASRGTDAHLFYYTNAFEEGLRTATAKGYDGITIHNDRVSAEQVKQAQDSGLQVALFGIDVEDEAIKKGADILEVDMP